MPLCKSERPRRCGGAFLYPAVRLTALAALLAATLLSALTRSLARLTLLLLARLLPATLLLATLTALLLLAGLLIGFLILIHFNSFRSRMKSVLRCSPARCIK